MMLPHEAEIISFTLCDVRAAAPKRHLMKETFPYFIHLMAHELPLRLSNGLMEGLGNLGMESRSTQTVSCLAFRVTPGGRNVNAPTHSVSLVCPYHRLHPFIINATVAFVAGRNWRGDLQGRA